MSSAPPPPPGGGRDPSAGGPPPIEPPGGPHAPSPATTSAFDPPPPSGPGAGPWAPDASGPSERWSTSNLAFAGIAAGLVGLLLGTLVGLAGSGGDEPAEQQAEIQRLEREVASLEDELALATGRPTTPGEAADEPAEPPETDGGQTSTTSESEVTVGDFRFANIQVRPDFVDDFQIRARMSNEGSESNDFVSISATILDADGDILAVLSGMVTDAEPGSTTTVELHSTDTYVEEWDVLEIEVDAF